MELKWNITKWCKIITDSGEDEYTGRDVSGCEYSFRLLDDDGNVYAYGMSNDDSSFEPLDYYAYNYGVTEIQYKNPKTGRYETL